MNILEKTMLATALSVASIAPVYAFSDVVTNGNNFTMLDVATPPGLVGGANDVTFTWNGTYNTSVATASVNATLSTTTPFFNLPWTAHHVMLFGPGTYTIYAGCNPASSLDSAAYSPACGTGTAITFTVAAGEIGAHMLFDWGGSTNIDVVDVWRVGQAFSPSPIYGGSSTATVSDRIPGLDTKLWDGMSYAFENSGYNGMRMIDGPFPNFKANFNVMGITAYTAPTMPPTVYPLNAATGVFLNDVVTVTFNKPVLKSTVLSAFTLNTTTGSVPVAGTVACSGVTVTTSCSFTPSANLTASTGYTAALTTAIQDAAGVALSSGYTWSFTTGLTTDSALPSITSHAPTGASATDAALSSVFTVTFNKSMTASTISSAFTVVNGSGATVAGNVTTSDNRTFTFTPTSALSYSTTYTATVSVAARDARGLALATPLSWSITTLAAPVPTPGVAASGAAGGGCAMNPAAGSDAGLLLAVLSAFGYIGWRRASRTH